MKYALWILGYAALILPMEHPDQNLLAGYISPTRYNTLNAIRTEFKITQERWTPFIYILKRLHDLTRQTTNGAQNDLLVWKETQEQICANALLHQSITAQESALYLAVIRSFYKRKMAPPLLKLELFTKADRSMQTSEEILYETSIEPRTQIDELAASLPYLERRVTIHVNLQELKRFPAYFVSLAAEHEIGHYYHIDCVTSSLLHNLIREQKITDEIIFKSHSWAALEELMEEEADNFMINGDPMRISLAQKYIVSPGHWNFKLELLLFEACKTDKAKIVQELIQEGALINSHDEHTQDTALHIAAYQGNTHIANLLLTAGAAIEAKNNQFETALHVACMRGHTALVTLLNTHHANPNVKKEGGITPLMLAAYQGNIPIIDLLLVAGARANERANDNKRAYHFAQENNKHAAIKRLEAEMGITAIWQRLWD